MSLPAKITNVVRKALELSKTDRAWGKGSQEAMSRAANTAKEALGVYQVVEADGIDPLANVLRNLGRIDTKNRLSAETFRHSLEPLKEALALQKK
jgi:hypothetical protein